MSGEGSRRTFTTDARDRGYNLHHIHPHVTVSSKYCVDMWLKALDKASELTMNESLSLMRSVEGTAGAGCDENRRLIGWRRVASITHLNDR